MTIGGVFLIACILTIFAAFATTLAWGVHQTNAALRERTKETVVDFTPDQATKSERRLRAA